MNATGDAALGDDVPRTRITVTDHRMIAGQETGETTFLDLGLP